MSITLAVVRLSATDPRVRIGREESGTEVRFTLETEDFSGVISWDTQVRAATIQIGGASCYIPTANS